MDRPNILLSEPHCLRLVEVRAADHAAGVHAEYELRRGCFRGPDGDWRGGERLPVTLSPHRRDPVTLALTDPWAEAREYCRSLGYVTDRPAIRRLADENRRRLPPLAIDLESWRADDRPSLALAPAPKG